MRCLLLFVFLQLWQKESPWHIDMSNKPTARERSIIVSDFTQFRQKKEKMCNTRCFWNFFIIRWEFDRVFSFFFVLHVDNYPFFRQFRKDKNNGGRKGNITRAGHSFLSAHSVTVLLLWKYVHSKTIYSKYS